MTVLKGPLLLLYFTLFINCRYFWRKHLRAPEPVIYLISSFWGSIPSGIDAAYEVTSKDTVFLFKGNCHIT